MRWRVEVVDPVIDGVRDHVADEPGQAAGGGVEQVERPVLDRSDQLLEVVHSRACRSSASAAAS
jgi:hypothetical protein